ncbi:MAG: hypothetical protein HY901_18990, partial [Deltaproteobacteria bacterium]|nr:hypothetical protein [Deltaproteobacteria bacterium]
MNAPKANGVGQLYSRIFWREIPVNIPTALLAAYVLGLVFRLEDAQVRVAVGVILPLVFAVSTGLQAFINRRVLARAIAQPEGEPPGARLKRLLEVPPRMMASSMLGWTGGGLLFGLGCAMAFGRDAKTVVAGLVVGLLTALMPSVLHIITMEDQLRPLVQEEFRRCGVRVEGQGPFWIRQRWSLPLAFVIALSSLVVFCGLALSAQFARVASSVVSKLATQDAALAQLAEQELTAMTPAAAWPVAIIGLFLVVSFVITGWQIARRQSRAVEAVERSLRAMAAGTPEPPAWVATDEVGDLAFSAAQISFEMQHIFTQLRAMAAGDLRAEIQGDSGLLRAFRDSRAGLLRLSDLMVGLARGELGSRPDVAGDLGTSFEKLHHSLQAIAAQAQKIAEGDLRL